MKPDWTPREFISNGIKVFCSPACGGKHNTCTLASYKKALAHATEMAKALGKDWLPVVDENLGWFSRARHKSLNITVFPDGPKCYSCSFGIAELQFFGRRKPSPKLALYAALDDFYYQLDTLLDIEESLKATGLYP